MARVAPLLPLGPIRKIGHNTKSPGGSDGAALADVTNSSIAKRTYSNTASIEMRL